MRVEDPILSMVAMRRSALRRSGAQALRRKDAERAPSSLELIQLRQQSQKLGRNLESIGVDHTRIYTGLDRNSHRIGHLNRPEQAGAAAGL